MYQPKKNRTIPNNTYMETLIKKTISTKQIREILTIAIIDVESDLVGVDYDEEGVYLYAFKYYDNSSSDVSMMINNVLVCLEDSQKEMIFSFLDKKVSEHFKSIA